MVIVKDKFSSNKIMLADGRLLSQGWPKQLLLKLKSKESHSTVSAGICC